MGLDVRITGGRDLGAVRQALREVGDRGLGRQLGKALRSATKPLDGEVRKEVPRVMPSGYAPALSKSLRFRTQVRESRQSAQVTYRVYGDGKKERRDVPALNRGILRHPVYGRTRPLKSHARYRATSTKNPWVAQKIRAGFVDRPVDRLVPEVRREMDAVVDWVANQITRG